MKDFETRECVVHTHTHTHTYYKLEKILSSVFSLSLVKGVQLNNCAFLKRGVIYG